MTTSESKIIVMKAPVIFSERYIKEFLHTVQVLEHIPNLTEFDYCEKDTNHPEAVVENTCLMALAYTSELDKEKHDFLLEKVSDRIKHTFNMFERGVILSIFESNFK